MVTLASSLRSQKHKAAINQAELHLFNLTISRFKALRNSAEFII